MEAFVKAPTISPDYYLIGEKRLKNIPSREERRLKIELDFLAHFNQRNPQTPLDYNHRELVVIQQDLYGDDFFVAPRPSDASNASIIRMDRVQKGFSWLYYSATYWLEKGKLLLLLTAETVLQDKACEGVVKKLLQGADYKGVFEISFGQECPYRVYEKGMKYLLMNLTNGMIFLLDKKDLPLLKPLGEKFSLDTMHFRRNGQGYVRY